MIGLVAARFSLLLWLAGDFLLFVGFVFVCCTVLQLNLFCFTVFVVVYPCWRLLYVPGRGF